MTQQLQVNVNSEFGKLGAVILHTPTREVESMSPTDAARALYSDILNLNIAQHEYKAFSSILSKCCQTFEVEQLLTEVLEKAEPKRELLEALCPPQLPGLLESLLSEPAAKLAKLLIEGVPVPRNRLTNFLREERYAIPPLYNLYFTRDASMSVFNHVLIGNMASPVRYGETMVMRSIFTHSDSVHAPIFEPALNHLASQIRIEGGDVHIVREDILAIGLGMRTSSQGIDFLVDQLVAQGLEQPLHIIVQELPDAPESFIHLDMVFTLLDQDACMVYSPLLLDSPQYRTIHMQVLPNGKTTFRYEQNIVDALNALGFSLKPVICGGTGDPWHQEREQWHSGANFFAFAPGQILGYARNTHTIAQLNRQGFEVLRAEDILSGSASIPAKGKCVITIEGSELPRGGGGARCMTMPVIREKVNW